MVQLSTSYTDFEPSKSPHTPNFQRSTIGYLSNSWACCLRLYSDLCSQS